MSYSAALQSIFLPFRKMFPSAHAWHYDDGACTRACTICGQKEELETDIVSSNWNVVTPGNKVAHTR